MTYKHKRCPHCDTEGREVTKDGETVLVCETKNCRVFTYAIYWG